MLDKGLDCAEEEGGDAEASATDDDKTAGSGQADSGYIGLPE